MIRALGLILAALLALTGCSIESTSGNTNDNPPAGSNADKGGDNGDEQADGGGDDKQPTFGQSYTWDNGLTLTVSKPKPFKPSAYAAGAEKPGTSLRFEITVVNKTGKPYEIVGDYVTLQSGNTEAEQIFDSEKGLNGTPNTPVLDGREAKYSIGFQVQKPQDLVMQYQPGDWALNEVIFTN